MSKNLVIVESPAKAKTIAGFLGADFEVESSFGHIRDLIESGLGVDVENGFKPDYVVPKDKAELVRKLKKKVKETDLVWLASDEDREGEAIAWHLAEALGLDPIRTNRIVFHEITKKAILKAVEQPRTIDLNLVNAQQARRVLDRLVGYQLSPVLWKKVKRGLSAGRVQSVAVRLVVEREREVQKFVSGSAFRVVAEFEAKNRKFKAELDHRFEREEDAAAFVQSMAGTGFQVGEIELKPAKKSPSAPFTTSTLQQEAARKLGYSVSTTMQLAQKLYEEGHITYMRTDSVNLSDDALAAARDQIVRSYGEAFAQTRKFQTKSKGAQEAHEAIRPTYFDRESAGAEPRQKKLYELIRKRSLASQMSDAQLERTTVTIPAPDSRSFVAKGEVIRFEGFLKLYLEGHDDEDAESDSVLLPALERGQTLGLSFVEAVQRYNRPPARYTEASLVKKLEELGIGRPSTYAPTLSTIVKRGYAEKSDLEGHERNYRRLWLESGKLQSETLKERTGADKGKLIPTDIGSVVNDFLVEHFAPVLDFHFTAQIEEEFDRIAEGEEDWVDMMQRFYGTFHQTIEQVEETAGYAKGERHLGDDPKSGLPVYAKIARYGPVVQLGSTESEDKPRFAGLNKGQSLETITLEEALKLFDLPRKLGEFEGKVLKTSIGRFGPYIQHGDAFVSLPKDEGDDPYTITLDRAVELVLAKREKTAKSLIKRFEGDPVIEILEGRWGPYIKSEKENYKLPKDRDPSSLERAEVEAIIAAAPAPRKGGFSKKAATTKKTEASKKPAASKKGKK